MNNTPAIFDYNTNPVRIITDENNNPLFVAKDVCDILGLSNPTEAIRPLDDDEKNTLRISEGISGNPNVNVITESGLYTLILRSNKPEARPFRRWVTHEVLPSIRKTGVYAADGCPTDRLGRLISDALCAQAEGMAVLAEGVQEVGIRLERLERRLTGLVKSRSVYGPVYAFVNARCRLGSCYVTAKDDLYAAFGEYCKAEGMGTMHRNHFLKNLYRYCTGYTIPAVTTRNGVRTYLVRGITLERDIPAADRK